MNDPPDRIKIYTYLFFSLQTQINIPLILPIGTKLVENFDADLKKVLESLINVG